MVIRNYLKTISGVLRIFIVCCGSQNFQKHIDSGPFDWKHTVNHWVVLACIKVFTCCIQIALNQQPNKLF